MEKNNPFDKARKPKSSPEDAFEDYASSSDFPGLKKNLGLRFEILEPEDQEALIKLIEILTDRYSKDEVINKIFALTHSNDSAIEVFKLLNGIQGKAILNIEKVAQIIPNSATGVNGVSLQLIEKYRREVELCLQRKEILEYIKTLD